MRGKVFVRKKMIYLYRVFINAMPFTNITYSVKVKNL